MQSKPVQSKHMQSRLCNLGYAIQAMQPGYAIHERSYLGIPGTTLGYPDNRPNTKSRLALPDNGQT
eukprot:11903174-Karenia_brevis.AAC.1